MAIFAVLLDDTDTALNFLEQVREKFKSGNYLKNPFKASLKIINQIVREKDIAITKKMAVIEIEPIYFNYPLIGAFTSTVLLMVSYWALIPLAVFLFLSSFWTSLFYYPLFKLGLRKAGYKGKIERVGL